MKKIINLLVLISFFTISCQKALDTPVQSQTADIKTMAESTPLEAKIVLNGGEIVVLKMIMTPAVVCDSYRNGENPKPCNIFVDFTCTLSKPISGYVKVDVEKTTMPGASEARPDGVDASNFSFNIAPNTTKFSYRSTFQNNNNIVVADNRFRIQNVSVYKFMN